MANLAKLQVELGANPTPLISGVNRAEKALAGFGGNTKKIGSSLSKGFKKPQSQIKGTTMAVTNFNRVVQDAPFGIMGVANNLEPMIQSFNSLKAQTGSTTTALTTLLKSAFTGPGALITAVSVASSLAIVFSQRMRGAGKASKDTKKELEATTSAVDELSKKFNSLAGLSLTQETEREIEVIDRAIRVAEEREKAQRRINEINAEANNRSGELSDALAKELVQKRNIRDTSDDVINRLGFEVTSVAELTDKRKELTNTLDVYNNSLTEQERVAKRVDDIQAKTAQSIDAYTAGAEGSQQALVGLAQQYQQRISDLQSEGQLTQEQIVEVNALKDAYKDLTGSIKETEGVELPDFTASGSVNINALPQISDEDAQAEANTVKPPKLPVMPEFELGNIEGSIGALNDRVRAFQRAQEGATNADVYNELQAQIDKTQAKINEITGATNEASDATTDLGATGDASFKMMSQGLGSVVGALIAGKKEALSFKNVLGALLPGILNIITGGSSGVFGAFASSLFGGFFAGGGQPPMGKVSVVGEQGPELFVPNTKGTILPNEVFGGAMSKTVNVQVTGVLKGEDIHVSGSRGNIRFDR